jgi:hypothetical protein
MTDAPETIWARPDPYEPDWTGDKTLRSKSHVEYRRADLPLTTEQIMADPRVKALVEALNVIAERPTHEGGCYYNNRLSVFEARAALAQLKEPKE